MQFESIDFNERFIATVPSEYDPVALRETFSPGFLDWVAGIDADVDFGVSERQLYFNWRLRELTAEEYEEALDNAGQLFRRIRSEMVEHGIHTYDSGPWHAGLEPFPGDRDVRRHVAGVARHQHLPALVGVRVGDHVRHDRRDVRLPRGGDRVLRGREREQRLELLDRGEHRARSRRPRRGRARPAGFIHAASTISLPSGSGGEWGGASAT